MRCPASRQEKKNDSAYVQSARPARPTGRTRTCSRQSPAGGISTWNDFMPGWEWNLRLWRAPSRLCRHRLLQVNIRSWKNFSISTFAKVCRSRCCARGLGAEVLDEGRQRAARERAFLGEPTGCPAGHHGVRGLTGLVLGCIEAGREARVVTIRKTTNGHHQLALALMHHGVRKNNTSRKKKNQ